MVRSPDLFCKWHLAANAAQRFGAGKIVPFLEAGDLGVAVGGDDDGVIDSLVDAGFEEQGHVVDDHGLRVLSYRFSRQSDLFTRDTGMDDGFNRASFRWMAKDDGSECLAIEAAVRIEDGLAECFDDLPPSRLARLHDIASQLVGIDHHRAALLEHLGDGAFAGGDTACEADQDHAAEHTMRVRASQQTLIDLWLERPV